jgi:hypothetical protein
MFITFLHDTNPDAILDDRSFAEAVTTGYGTDLQELWLRRLNDW